MQQQIMGAVRVKVKLTNAIDEAMVSRGILAPGRPHHVNKRIFFSISSIIVALIATY